MTDSEFRKKMIAWSILGLITFGVASAIVFFLNYKVSIEFHHGLVTTAGNPLHDAVRDGDSIDSVMSTYLNDPNWLLEKEEFAGTPFDLAIIKGRLDCVDFFLSKGYDPNQPIHTHGVRDTPLGWATYPDESPDAIRLLLKYGADPDFAAPGGKSALELAQANNLLPLVELLHSEQESPNAVHKQNTSDTPKAE